MNYLPKSLAFALFAAVFTVSPSSSVELAQDTTEVSVNWRQKLGTFRVGIIGGNRPVVATRRAQPFRKALQQALGMPVEIYATPDRESLIDAQMNSRIEYAVHSAQSFAMTNLICKCIEPMVVASDRNGSTAFQSVLYARTGAFSTLAGAKEKTILVPGTGSFAGYQLPNFLIAGTKTLPGLDSWNLDNVKSMESLLKAFAKGNGDGFFGWQKISSKKSGADDNNLGGSVKFLQRIKGATKIKLTAVWKSPPVPHGPHVVGKNLHPKAKAILRATLAVLHDDNSAAYEAIEHNNFGGFVPVTEADYESASRFVKNKMTPVRQTVAAKADKTSAVQTK